MLLKRPVLRILLWLYVFFLSYFRITGDVLYSQVYFQYFNHSLYNTDCALIATKR